MDATILFPYSKNKSRSSHTGTPSKHMWQLLGDGVGAEEPRRGDAEPGHRKRIRKQLVFAYTLHPVCPSNLTGFLCVVYLQVKCAQYWPHREEKDAVFEDTNFKLTLVSEDVKYYYTVRQLELENLSVSLLFQRLFEYC